MALRIHNNLTRRTEEFVPRDQSEVGMYVCGITPYDESHLGHARAYVTFDVIRRYLEYSGFKVKHVQNITDIDDKIIKKSNEQKVSSSDIAEKYSASFFDAMDKLNVRRASVYPKATEHIPEMVKWIAGLMEKGFAYKLSDGVYFEVSKFKDYGKLSRRKTEEQQAGARVEVDSSKRDPLDFALWKFAKPGEPAWDSPWGAGRPGWHIECSVMSTKYLGEQFDIHGGGLDLQFPHHENEIAQTEALTGKVPWVKYWVHNGFVTINQQKMSKSLGNFFSLKDIFKQFDPMAVRLFLLSTHYRSPLNFSGAQLAESKEAYGRLVKTIAHLDFLISKVPDAEAEVEVLETDDELDGFRKKFEAAMDDDFNTAGAVGAIFELVRFINEHVKEEKIDKESLEDDKKLLLELCGVLGIDLRPSSGEEQLDREVSRLGLPDDEVEALVKSRETARKNKDFKESDRIRDELEKNGIILEDTPYGTKWSRNA
ncbi:MAG TPA: cysteine--tRNA ligase [Candidatus Omnitrophota bacterium]|nr:cysteine--tRNA ligase [Candidatus Omnitrophota bacterium]